jgi:2-amino-4-hydroxy-6-hydroxymethyldihydropteridine diphosphokinase
LKTPDFSPPVRRIGLGLGANLGDPPANLRDAVERLRGAGIEFDALSSLYRTKPWGVTDQPDFINACALARTRLNPVALLECVQAVEHDMGRRRSVRWGPRPIDIDILFYDDLVSADPRLSLPHPGLLERAFVLLPLAEIAPELVVRGQRLGEASMKLDSSGVVRVSPFY